MVPILDQLIGLSVEDNEAYAKCRELACGVRQRLLICKEKPMDVAFSKKATAR